MEIGTLSDTGTIPAAAAARHLAVIHLKPDCVMRGLAGESMAYLAEHGFQIRAFRIGCPPRELLWLMHGRSLDSTVDDWFHNIRLYEFGPALTLLLRSDSAASSPSAQERLRRLKGRALPKSWQSGTLRGDLGAGSRIFNLVHCADDVAAACEEALPYFGAGALDAAVQSTGETLPSADILAEIASHAYSPAYDGKPASVWSGWKRRISHASGGSAPEEAAAIEALLGKLESAAGDVLGFRGLLMLMERLNVYSSTLERYVLESYFLYRDGSLNPAQAVSRTV